MEHSTQQRLIENITLLWTVNEVPGRPETHVLDCTNREGRHLTLKRERQLAENFAFLSASTDDMLRVMALCVEEDLDKKGMTIRLASNTGELLSTRVGLRSITAVLETSANRVKDESRESTLRAVLRQIVEFDEPRILSRLRSRHAVSSRKTRGKPPLFDLLFKTINDSCLKVRGKGARVNLQRVLRSSENMLKVFDTFEAAHGHAPPGESQAILADLLSQAHEFDTKSLGILLHSSSTVDPTLKSFLPEAISKLAQYYGIAIDLIAAARGSQNYLFRRLSVEVVEIPAVCAGGSPNGAANGAQRFDEVLKRFTESVLKPRSQGYGTIAAARERFSSRLTSHSTSWKVHAEMQLLLFYEQNPDILPPRIICSSKSACFLCDLFIKCHGKFQVPKTHGRIYDRWTLPEWTFDPAQAGQELSAVVQQFNDAVETKIMQVVKKSQKSLPHPNESSLRLQEPWSSSSTLPIHPDNEPKLGATAQIPPETPQELDTSSNITPGNPKLTFSARSLSYPSTVGIQGSSNVQATVLSTVEDEVSETSRSSTNSYALSGGHTVNHMLSSSSEKLVIHTAKIDLQVSWDWASDEGEKETNESGDIDANTTDPAATTRWTQIQWLLATDLPGTPNAHQEWSEVVNIETLRADQDTVIEDHDTAHGPWRKPLAIRYREDVLLLRWSSLERELHGM